MSKQQLAAILEMGAQNPPPANATPAEMRAWIEGVASQLPTAENVQIKRVNCGPCDGELIVPAGRDASRLIILYHGGGFFFAVYQWALKQGYAPGKVALSGDSSGGNLALATVVRAKESGLALPGALTLMSPWLDVAREGASHQGTPDDPVVSPEILDLFTRCYLGDGDRKSPTVTPFYADFSGLPPTLVHVGTRERLHDDSVTVVERMKTAGVAADLKIFDGMSHNWQLYAPMLDEGMASIEECAAFIKAHQA